MVAYKRVMYNAEKSESDLLHDLTPVKLIQIFINPQHCIFIFYSSIRNGEPISMATQTNRLFK
jgi:hypothetical protein